MIPRAWLDHEGNPVTPAWRTVRFWLLVLALCIIIAMVVMAS